VPLPPPPVLPGPPIRRIETAQIISAVPFVDIQSVRPLSGGRVLVNDGAGRRLLMLDSSLALVKVVLDSTSESPLFYGANPNTLVTGRGDTSAFLDTQSASMLILDGEGRIVRVRAMPRGAEYFSAFRGTTTGLPVIDQFNRLVLRQTATPAPPAVAPPPGVPYIPTPPDSAFLVASHLDARKLDTLGVVRIPLTIYSYRVEPEGYTSLNVLPNPLPLTDDWVLRPDGTLAIVRGTDYRVDYRSPTGTWSIGEPMPFPWVRMTEDLKTSFVDSVRAAQVKTAQTSFATQMIAWSNQLNKPYPASFTPPADYVPPPGMPSDWILPKGISFPASYLAACPPGTQAPPSGPIVTLPPTTPDGPPRRCTTAQTAFFYGGGRTPPPPTYRPPTLVRKSEIPERKPPIAQGTARADFDGNIWVRPNTMQVYPGGFIYDVINAKGELFDRVQLPAGYAIAGFGPDRTVYVTVRDATSAKLAKVKLR
jgi:hypothetical protein